MVFVPNKLYILGEKEYFLKEYFLKEYFPFYDLYLNFILQKNICNIKSIL